MHDEEIGEMSRLEPRYWYWIGKNDLFTRLLKKFLNKPGKVLDVGCGTGSNMRNLQRILGRKTAIYGIDSSRKAISIIKKMKLGKNIRPKVGDAEKLPFPDNYFDAVVASDVLEHVKHDRKAAAEIFRVLKKGGIALITVPMFMHLWGADDARLLHYRRYRKKELNRLLDIRGAKALTQCYTYSFVYPSAFLARQLEKRFNLRSSFEQLVKNAVLQEKGHSVLKGINSGLTRANLVENWLIERGIGLPFGVGTVTILVKED